MQIQSREVRLKLIALIFLFSVPLLGAHLLYQYHDYFHFKTINQGTLLNPIRKDAALIPPLKKTWQLLFIPENCTSAKAAQVMFKLHQLRRALGQNSERVSLLLMTQKNCPQLVVHDFRYLTFNADQYKKLQQSVSQSTATDKIYLVDTLGNIFMYYSAESDALPILEDLNHVLGVSQIG